MKNILLLCLSICVFVNNSNSQDIPEHNTIQIIPQPVSVKKNKGSFKLNKETNIYYTHIIAENVASFFKDKFNAASGYSIKIIYSEAIKNNNAVIFKINNISNKLLGEEGYTLDISTEQTLITANSAHGLFNGMQSLIQLLPAAIESKKSVTGINWKVENLQIVDYPKFGWRGLMLDVSRHFFSKNFVKKYLDEMAKCKLNVFHMHLSDDHGWRLEIKGMPELTNMGAWRVPRQGPWGGYPQPEEGEKATYGGYYTQNDVHEIVAYAKQRFITVVPEIDVPAHSLALIASYPNLSCSKKQYAVNAGFPFMQNEHNVLCIANDSTYKILDQIFTQVAELFPGEYIHVGGDEANHSFWAKHAADLELMKNEGLKTYDELQGYFEKRMEELIKSKGKKMICWYGKYAEGLEKESAVMSWEGMGGGIVASKLGHKVVMSPGDFAYLDFYQGDPIVEPANAILEGMIRLKKAYEGDIVPAGAVENNILGGQGNIWTESIPTEQHVEYMTWPRAMALSEIFWSPSKNKNWLSFTRRIEHRFKNLEIANVIYAKSIYDPIVSGLKVNNEVKAKIESEFPGLTVRYTFDGTNPSRFSNKYSDLLSFPKGATEIRMRSFRGDEPVGVQIKIPLHEISKRIK